MAVDNHNLAKRISDLTQYIEDLRTRGISDPGNMAEILSDAVDELQVSLEELSTAEEELCQQNEELMVAHEELYRHQEHLEELVRDRTGELEAANAKLQEEINEREAAEKAVKAERQRFIDVLETLPAYLVLLTPDYHVPFANRFFRERFGESHGRPCFEYLFKRSEPCEICETYSVLKTNKPHHWEWTGPDGRNYDIFDFPFTDSDGSTLIMETGIDITERKRAEEALRVAGAYNRSLIEASLDPLVTIGPDGKITDVNAATESVTGYSRGELIGTDFSDYFTKPESARAGYQQVFKEGLVRDFALEIRHRDGHITPVLYNATVYRDDVGHVVGVFAAARDVTAQKQASQYARTLIESSQDPLVTISADGKITDVNEATVKVTGVPREQLIGTDFSNYFTEPKKAREGYQQVFDRSFVKDYPLTIRHLDGQLTDVLYNASVYKDISGNVLGVFAAARDITERKRAEIELEKYREHLEELVRERTRELEAANSQLQAEIIERKRAEEALQRNSERLEILSETASCLLASSKPQEIVNELCTRVMKFLDCHAFFNFLTDDRLGKLHLNAYAGVPDETAHEIEWLDYGVAVCGCVARDGHRIIAENIPEMPDPRTDLVKSFGIKAYACHPLKAQGKVIGTLSFGTCSRTKFDDEDVAMMNAVADQVAIAMIRIQAKEALHKARDELEQRVAKRTSELQNAKEELEVINEELSIEIDEHKRTEKELLAAKESAEEAAKVKAAFMANMSHELRTPMNAVIGMTSLLLETKLDAEQRDFVETVRTGGEALMALISDILDFSRVEKEKVELEQQPLSLRTLVEESLDLVATQANDKDLNLSHTIKYGTPDIIIGDPGRLRQILVNLLSNAVKFTDAGDVSVFVSSKAIESSKHQILFKVMDTGIGIPQDKMDKLFQPFGQLEMTISRKRDGAGLGLAISKGLVELMGGEIWVESKSGVGSTFYFTIPAEVASVKCVRPEKAARTARAVSENLAELHPLRILVAEDNHLNQKMLLEMLKKMGYRADAVADGREVLQALERQPYDLVLMDIRMPEMDGIAATREICKRWPNACPKIVAITAYALAGDKDRCLNAGMDGYIAKPVQMDELAEVLKRYTLEAQ
jgi:PAS domain S-box-containing protein